MGVAMNMQWRRKRKLCSRPHSFGKYSDATKCAAKAATAVSFTLPLLTVRACAAIKNVNSYEQICHLLDAKLCIQAGRYAHALRGLHVLCSCSAALCAALPRQRPGISISHLVLGNVYK